MRRIFTSSLIFVALAAAGVAWHLARAPRPQAVFLIVVDTLRADRLSCYGYADHDTPHIDALAARGVQFDNAISVGGWTIPSMGAMMTSLYPTQLGLIEKPKPRQRYFKVRERREQLGHTLDERYATMPETFRDAGYHTAAFVNQPVLTNQYGFRQGFSEWFRAVSRDTILRFDPDDNHYYSRSVVADDVYLADSALVDAFTGWLPTAPREDLFVWVHLLSPHWPYEPPDRYGVSAGDTPSRLYDGEVRYTDDMIGTVIDAIDAHVGLDNALIIFTSDHGEEFGERGSKDHGHSLHRECVNVPLLVSGPGIDAGGRVSAHVPLIDVFPTLADRCGLALPAGTEGVDLLVAARHDGGTPVYSEGMLYGSSERSLIDGGLRIMWEDSDDTYRLFDLAADPGERRDLAGERPGDVARLRDALVSLHDRLVQEFGEQTVADSLKSAQERERALKAMRSLGYVNE